MRLSKGDHAARDLFLQDKSSHKGIIQTEISDTESADTESADTETSNTRMSHMKIEHTEVFHTETSQDRIGCEESNSIRMQRRLLKEFVSAHFNDYELLEFEDM